MHTERVVSDFPAGSERGLVEVAKTHHNRSNTVGDQSKTGKWLALDSSDIAAGYAALSVFAPNYFSQ
jgi:hypothetical protein